MKTRVLYFSGKGKMATYAEILAKKFETKEDVIPPAYPCDKEKLVILGISVKNGMPDLFLRFCKELSAARAANVALFVDGNEQALAPITEAIRTAGANVLEPVFFCKGGLPFKFAKKVTAEEKDAICAWADGLVSTLSV